MSTTSFDWRLMLFTAVFDFLYGGAEITGYHVWAFGGIFLFFHIPFVWNASWSWRSEAHVVGAFALFWVLEDYLWFVFNPHFGWRALRPDKAFWHKRWLWGLPVNYYISGFTGLFLFLIR
jgi:hypothetical protein